MLNTVVEFFSHPFFTLSGAISVSASIILSFYVLYIVARGVLPVWYRLGIALSRRKIAILAVGDDYDNLKNVLIDSKLFKAKNIKKIEKSSILSAKNESLLLVHWESYKESLDAILENKQDTAALIIYAPAGKNRIDNESMEKMSQHRNITIVNFRGRLINDMFVSMITSG